MRSIRGVPANKKLDGEGPSCFGLALRFPSVCFATSAVWQQLVLWTYVLEVFSLQN